NGRPLLAIAPDGSSFVYAAGGRLHLKKMSEFKSTAISGSEVPGTGPINPAFSPDSRSVAFFSDGDKTINRISIDARTPITICQAESGFGMSWSADNNILFGESGKGVMRVSANGGKAEAIIATEKNEQARSPQLLPSGAVLFTVASEGKADKPDVVVQTPG